MLIIASYIVMILYAALSLSAKRSDESRVGVGFAGIGIVALAVASSFGLAGLLDIAFNPTSTQVLPFSPLVPLTGCFLTLGSGLGLVGTASARR